MEDRCADEDGETVTPPKRVAHVKDALLHDAQSNLVQPLQLTAEEASLWCSGAIQRVKHARKLRPDKAKYHSGNLTIVVPPQGKPTRISPLRGEVRTDSLVKEVKASQQKNQEIVAKLEKKAIVKCERISDFFDLQSQLTPSNATVYKAQRKSDGLDVVVKTREKHHWRKNNKRQEEQEWRRSADMLLNLPKSDSIANVYAVYEDEHCYYVVMEKVHGLDLFEVLHSNVRISAEETNAILQRLLEAVLDLHSKGCIHKDLKLENVMLDSPILERNPWSRSEPSGVADLKVKIIDFDTLEPFSPKAKAKRVVGTDQYIAQEAYAGHYSPASDVFSVGVIAYRLIAGALPFTDFKFDDCAGENWVGSPKMQDIQDRLKQFEVNFDAYPWTTQPLAKELVSWMLQNNEADRPTAEQALQHEFFKHMHC
jgi:hypothetical protein